MRPRHLWRTEAAEGGARGGVGQQSSNRDARIRNAVRTAGEVIGLRDNALGNVRIRTQQEVALNVLERDGAVGLKPGADMNLTRRPAHFLEGLLEGEEQPDGPARSQCEERDERLVLGVLLAAEGAARIGSDDADPGQR